MLHDLAVSIRTNLDHLRSGAVLPQTRIGGALVTISLTSRPDPAKPHHPAVIADAERHAADIQLKVAATITRFAGSMAFVYLHIALFGAWMLFFEKSPWEKLTLIVSLEAIFLSTFVMIGQNRSAAFQQAKADHDFVAQEQELQDNTVLTKEIHELTRQIHAATCGDTAKFGSSSAT